MAAIENGRDGLIATLAFALEALIVGSPWILLLVLGILAYRRWHSLKPLPEEVSEQP